MPHCNATLQAPRPASFVAGGSTGLRLFPFLRKPAQAVHAGPTCRYSISARTSSVTAGTSDMPCRERRGRGEQLNTHRRASNGAQDSQKGQSEPGLVTAHAADSVKGSIAGCVLQQLSFTLPTRGHPVPRSGCQLTTYTMRSLNRYDGRSGGVCSVASPDSAGMTCTTNGRAQCVHNRQAAGSGGGELPTVELLLAPLPPLSQPHRLHIQPLCCTAPTPATAAAARCCCWPPAPGAAQLRAARHGRAGCSKLHSDGLNCAAGGAPERVLCGLR